MPPKQKTPAPIDRPISRAYLREFSGWSTAYPPTLSDPTSLRKMENVMINRDASVRVRPGLRYLSYLTVPDGGSAGVPIDQAPVGTHEPFFLNDGTKAYLFAVREDDGTVGFRVLAQTVLGQVVVAIDSVTAGFSVPQGLPAIAFTAATTYVKYLQIDNKIFALSDAGETMRLFTVGTTKTAKKLNSIARPEWNVADKLTVVHPDAGWVNSGIPLTTRQNLSLNPAYEVNHFDWTCEGEKVRSSTFAQAGTVSMRVNSVEQRTNLVSSPLHDTAALGTANWTIGQFAVSFVNVGGYGRITAGGGAGDTSVVNSPQWDVEAAESYRIAMDVANAVNTTNFGCKVRWYTSAGVQIGSPIDLNHPGMTTGRKVFSTVTSPSGAAKMRIFPYVDRITGASAAFFDIKNVLVAKSSEATTAMDGSDGANYFWVGTTNDSSSVYHPPADVTLTETISILPSTQYIASGYIRAGSVVRNCAVDLVFHGAGTTTDAGAISADAVGSFTRFSNPGTSPAATSAMDVVVRVAAVPRGEYHYIDSILIETGNTLGTYFDGSTGSIPTDVNTWDGTAHASTSHKNTFSVGSIIPPAETKTVNTLIHSTPASNQNNFGFFYTFTNEVGESAASQVTVIRTQRAWAQWQWETPNGAGEPSGTYTGDPAQCADQLVAYMPSSVFSNALAAGAIKWSLYMFTWSNQDPVPVVAVKVDSRNLTAASVHGDSGWLRATPSQADAGSETSGIPTRDTRYNFTDPSRGGQGIVAADRMVLVKDPTQAAVIKWTSNQQGNYTDFSAAKGGGFKTLTSGNLYIPACVKLWQNPQSADTLTILCLGVDGQSTAYYMAPAQVASQSEAVNVMGFEETTATPGTTSPYGVEVFNNALYHPLDEQLMKSTANNYNISHKSQTEQILNAWQGLTRKEWIISSVHDGRLYYIVNNPDGEVLESGCNGNEIWVFDGGSDSGTWSRWLIQAHSLRKIEQGGRIYMSVVRPDGIFYLDENTATDEYVSVTEGSLVLNRPIPWYLETNTQGANRSHDAWAHVQQLTISVGNMLGHFEWGLRGFDLHGKRVLKTKVTRDAGAADELMWDLDDHLQIRRDMKEWFFFAGSTLDSDGHVLPSQGQINSVQYRYTPSTVNTGYEFGSVETFEYARSDREAGQRTTDSGVPMPMMDQNRP